MIHQRPDYAPAPALLHPVRDRERTAILTVPELCQRQSSRLAYPPPYAIANAVGLVGRDAHDHVEIQLCLPCFVAGHCASVQWVHAVTERDLVHDGEGLGAAAEQKQRRFEEDRPAEVEERYWLVHLAVCW